MRTGVLWIAAAVILAVIVHIVVVLAVPSTIMGIALNGMAEAGATPGPLHPPRPDASSRGVVRPSPDLAYSVCLFDMNKGPLVIRTQIPETYWSLSAYGANTDNFFAVNDTQVRGDTFSLMVRREEDEVTDPNTPVVFPPSDKGLILMRALVTNDEMYRAVNEVRQATSCEVLDR